MIHCLFRYSTDAGTSSCLWSFNPLLLRLLGEISLSFLCSYISRGSALDLDWPLHVGRLRASALRSHRAGLKSSCFGGSGSLRPGGGRGTDAGRACGCRGRMTLQQPEAHRVFSWGSCPWITGAWLWWAAQVPGRGSVDCDLCLHTGFLVVAEAALASHACLWGPR